MAARNSLDLERERVIKDYGADKGAVQTLARLADYIAKVAA